MNILSPFRSGIHRANILSMATGPQRAGALIGLMCILAFHSICAVAAPSVIGSWNISGKSTGTGGGQHITIPLMGYIKFNPGGSFIAAPDGFRGTWRQSGATITATPSDSSVKNSLIRLFKQAGVVVTVNSVRSVKASLSLAGSLLKGKFSYVVYISVPGTNVRNLKISGTNVFSGRKRSSPSI